MLRNEIRIRDPFIFCENNHYYMYGSTDANTWSGKGHGFLMYESNDLEHFKAPVQVFSTYKGFWGESQFWAPEVYKIENMYYMTASFFKEGEGRGTMILKAEKPQGPFIPVVNHPVTPVDWECLDGTLYVENKESVYLIFSHEWLQIEDGEICVAKLKRDFSGLAEKPRTLFRGSDGPWVCGRREEGRKNLQYVTDGPFVYKMEDEGLLLLWSSYGENGYAIGQAVSYQGIYGPWKQIDEPLFSKDGGHGMIFTTIDNKKMLTIHAPNETGKERAVFIELCEKNGLLEEM